jgi:CubicO group peptidase (beta-lactamase class C family)
LTALTVASLIESGQLRYDTTLRSLLPRDLPMVDPRVTVEHLLGHTSMSLSIGYSGSAPT